MVKNALLGWVGSLVTIYNIVAKKNQLRVSNDLLELSCLYKNLRSVAGSSGLLETWGMLSCNLQWLVGVLQGMWWPGPLVHTCNAQNCSAPGQAIPSSQSSSKCPARHWCWANLLLFKPRTLLHFICESKARFYCVHWIIQENNFCVK